MPPTVLPSKLLCTFPRPLTLIPISRFDFGNSRLLFAQSNHINGYDYTTVDSAQLRKQRALAKSISSNLFSDTISFRVRLQPIHRLIWLPEHSLCWINHWQKCRSKVFSTVISFKCSIWKDETQRLKCIAFIWLKKKKTNKCQCGTVDHIIFFPGPD